MYTQKYKKSLLVIFRLKIEIQILMTEYIYSVKKSFSAWGP